MPRNCLRTVSVIAALLLAPAAPAETAVQLAADRTEIGMGESVTLTARVSTGAVATQSGHRIIPFVNGKRWGAIEETDASGQTVHHLPLPHIGPVEIRVLVEAPLTRAGQAQWIWGTDTPEAATQYFQREFQFAGDPESVRLYVAVDDEATVYLNGVELATVSGWRNAEPLTDMAEILLMGDNILSVAATNRGGLAGLLVRMDSGTTLENPLVLSGADWTFFPTAPYGWPYRAEAEGEPPAVLADISWSPYRAAMAGWPTLVDRSLDMAGTPIPASGLFSKPVTVSIQPRALTRPAAHPDRRVGIQFEPWFTPYNTDWQSTPAIPLTGPYWSWNRDVIRQQMIWLAESGIDFLIVDWANHLWGNARWDERDDRSNEIIHATTVLLETLAAMREEGHPTPQVALYLGLNSGPSTTVAALNEALAWIRHSYMRNPRFEGLFEVYRGKPLLLVHNSAGPDWRDAEGEWQVDDTHFSIRYQSSHHELNSHGDHGFWSWMDGILSPTPTAFGGEAEVLTVSTAFYAGGGWKRPGAYGRKNGWTLLQGFHQALAHRPRFLQIHQYQSFSGPWEGNGYGPERDIYTDSYSVALSSDMEPVSRTAAAYRGKGGWGFYYLNLLRALVDLYGQEEPETTVLVLSSPNDGSTVKGEELDVAWDWIGVAPESIELLVNGAPVAVEPGEKQHQLDLSPYPPGPLTLEISAAGTRSRYALSYTQASLPAEPMVPASATVVCLRAEE